MVRVSLQLAYNFERLRRSRSPLAKILRSRATAPCQDPDFYSVNRYTGTPVNSVWTSAFLAGLLGLLAFAGPAAI